MYRDVSSECTKHSRISNRGRHPSGERRGGYPKQLPPFSPQMISFFPPPPLRVLAVSRFPSTNHFPLEKKKKKKKKTHATHLNPVGVNIRKKEKKKKREKKDPRKMLQRLALGEKRRGGGRRRTRKKGNGKKLEPLTPSSEPTKHPLQDTRPTTFHFHSSSHSSSCLSNHPTRPASFH